MKSFVTVCPIVAHIFAVAVGFVVVSVGLTALCNVLTTSAKNPRQTVYTGI